LRDVIDLSARPDGSGVHVWTGRELSEFVAIKVCEPYVVRRATLIVEPVHPLGAGWDVGQLSVRGEIAKFALGHGERDGKSAVYWNLVKLVVISGWVGFSASINDVLAVWGPALDLGVRGIVGEAFRGAAIDRHHVDVGAAVIVGGEGDLGSVGREACVGLHAGGIGDSVGGMVFDGAKPEVAFAGEDDGVSVDVGLCPEGLLVCGGECGSEGQGEESKRATQGVTGIITYLGVWVAS
jgi:hypothetical protein